MEKQVTESEFVRQYMDCFKKGLNIDKASEVLQMKKTTIRQRVQRYNQELERAKLSQRIPKLPYATRGQRGIDATKIAEVIQAEINEQKQVVTSAK